MIQGSQGGARRGGARMSFTLAALAASLCACAPVDDQPRESGQRLISENDDRKEVFEHENAWMRSYAEQATVALADASRVVTSGGVTTLVDGPALGDALGLCPGERFAEQPVTAFCSGTLIDDDLVLTAGHCVPDAETCARTRFVFNYHYTAPGVRHSITAADVFSCHELVVHQSGDVNRGEPDFAIVRLGVAGYPRASSSSST